MPEHPLTTAWNQADAATRAHWIDEIVEFSDMMDRISAKNEARRRRSEQTGIPYEELLRREDAEYFARRNTAVESTRGSEYWNARRAKGERHAVRG